MATTIQSAFRTFKSNLEISGLQSSTMSTRQQNVREVLSNGLNILDSFLTGSYSRNTLIAPLKDADIDIFFVLDPQYYHNYNGQNGGQAGLLDLVKRTLRRSYTRTPDISRDGQAVTIRFTDFNVDVVPGFNRQGGGYLIPNSLSQSWLSTDPKRHVEIFSQANKDHNGDLVPLIKMIKCWNRNIDYHFYSFHLEVLALQILQNVTISDYPSGVRFFFDKGRELISKQNFDPAGYGGDVGNYIKGQAMIQKAITKFQTAYELSLKAEELARLGNIGDSIYYWRKLFGDYFPLNS